MTAVEELLALRDLIRDDLDRAIRHDRLTVNRYVVEYHLERLEEVIQRMEGTR